MRKDSIASIDCGTQSVKAIIFDTKGKILVKEKQSLSIDYYEDGRAEQRAEDWWDALCIVINKIRDFNIIGLSVTYQRETFVLLDSDLKPIRPAVLWMDQRAVKEVDDIEKAIGSGKFRQLTGKPLNPTPSLMKLLWVKKNEPENWGKMRKIMTVGAYINYKLTGNICDSHAGSDTTGLYDIDRRTWAKPLLELLDINTSHLFKLADAGEFIGIINNKHIHNDSFKNVPVFASGGDGQVFSLGVGAIKDTEMSLTLGTSGVCGVHTSFDSKISSNRKMVSCMQNKYLYEGIILSASNTVSWFIKNFYDNVDSSGVSNETPEDDMEKRLSDIPAGSDGLITIPYLNGCMMPYDDPTSRGATIGWSNTHTKAHFYKSILEGIAFELKLIIEKYEQEFDIKLRVLKIGGGGAQSDLWLQMIANITGLETVVTSTTENTALGAAMIIACSTGRYDNYLAAVNNMCAIRKRFYPIKEEQLFYKNYYNEVYKNIYPSLRTYLKKLGNNI